MMKTPVFLGISMVSRKNRRLLVVVTYAALLMVIATLSVTRPWNVRFSGVLLCIILAVELVRLGLFGSMVKQMMLTKRWGETISLGLGATPQLDEDRLDEREQAVRNAAYFEAYRVLAVCCFFVFGFLVSNAFEPLSSSPLGRVAFPLSGMLLFAIAWTLPQAVILWTEPDVPEEARV